MSALAEVFVPGPWWHALTYRASGPLMPGIRVRVPVGRGWRVGFVAPPAAEVSENGLTLRDVAAVLDEHPPLGDELWKLAAWVGEQYLCGMPRALECIAPGFLRRGHGTFRELPPWKASSGSPEDAFVFDPRDERRWERYREEVERGRTRGSVLVLFAEQSDAARFWETLSETIRRQGILWPGTGGHALRRVWEDVRSREDAVVVGARGALFAPLQRLALVLVDEEASGGHRFPENPGLHARTVASVRARLWGARFLAGGRMPSARLFRMGVPRSVDRPGDRLFFVDLHRTDAVAVAGVRDPLRVGVPSFRETRSACERGQIALWLLDRRGYAGEVACMDCGALLRCPACGGGCRGEAERYVCSFCGRVHEGVTGCPVCRGVLLQGMRPGLEALREVASDLFQGERPVCSWDGGKPGTLREICRTFRRSGGVVLGTRGALALCDHMPVGCVVWMDADAEARQPRYDARFVAYRMIWESLWRGLRKDDRTVVVQSRTPLRGWQESLVRGWDHFWPRELEERKLFDLPPYRYLISVDASPEIKKGLSAALEEQGLEPLDPDPEARALWLRTGALMAVRKALEPFFRIRRKGDFPRVSVERE